jgi:hypothetical protein
MSSRYHPTQVLPSNQGSSHGKNNISHHPRQLGEVAEPITIITAIDNFAKSITILGDEIEAGNTHLGKIGKLQSRIFGQQQ